MLITNSNSKLHSIKRVKGYVVTEYTLSSLLTLCMEEADLYHHHAVCACFSPVVF
jgi:hypothetical protein